MKNALLLLGFCLTTLSPLMAQTVEFGLGYATDQLSGTQLVRYETNTDSWLEAGAPRTSKLGGAMVTGNTYLPLLVSNSGMLSLGINTGFEFSMFFTGEEDIAHPRNTAAKGTLEKGNNMVVNVPVRIGFRIGNNAYEDAYGRVIGGKAMFNNIHLGASIGYGTLFYNLQGSEPYKGSRVLPELCLEMGYKWIVVKYTQQLKGLQVKWKTADEQFREGMHHQLQSISLNILWGVKGSWKRPK